MTTLFLVLVCLPAVLVAVPLDGIDQRARQYAELYPNTYDELDNQEYGELYGDIILLHGEEPPTMVGPLNAVWNKERLWPDGIIWYTLQPDTYTDEQVDQIEAGIEDLINSTMVNGEICVDIRKLEDEEDDVSNWILIGKFGGCSSALGQSPGTGPQTMSLEDSCVDRHGTIMHEFLHAYGFYHEHQRADRDDYVEINWDNIQDGYEGNFIKHIENVTIDHLGTHYDYGSVMHYHAYSFAINDTIPTIIPTDPDAEIGQRTHMSECDIERVKLLYGCITLSEASDCLL